MDAREFVKVERAELCDTFERLGPDAPTLCEGWDTSDLAAHLIVRERHPTGGPGILLGGPFARHTQRLMEREQAKSYDAMLALLRSGPTGLMGALPSLNVNENWIHHEDARRANGEGPRPRDPEREAVQIKLNERMGKMATRPMKGYTVRAEMPDGISQTLRTGDRGEVVLRAPVGEIVLYLAGRRDAAVVDLAGDPAAIEALRTAKLGV